jgi:hypothetical protein
MKHTILFLITLVMFVNMNATAHHTIFPTLKHTKARASNVSGKTTLMQFANSANGIFHRLQHS